MEQMARDLVRDRLLCIWVAKIRQRHPRATILVVRGANHVWVSWPVAEMQKHVHLVLPTDVKCNQPSPTEIVTSLVRIGQAVPTEEWLRFMVFSQLRVVFVDKGALTLEQAQELAIATISNLSMDEIEQVGRRMNLGRGDAEFGEAFVRHFANVSPWRFSRELEPLLHTLRC